MSSSKMQLKTLAGNDIIIVRNWHITIFTFLFSFPVLYICFDVFQPNTLAINANSYVVPSNDGTAGPYNLGTSNSDKSKQNKFLSDNGRIIMFAWSLGLALGVAIVIHFLLVAYN